MLGIFYPHEYVKSVFSIDYCKLQRMGYKGIIFDIDNTLAHHGEDSTKETDELFLFLSGIGLKTILLSDNSEERIKRFLKNIDAPYISEAGKPKISGFLKAVEMLGIEKNRAVMVGDQIFRDIYGANKSGIDNILVEYMRHEGESKIGIRRNLEKIILKFYGRSKRFQNRLGDIRLKEIV